MKLQLLIVALFFSLNSFASGCFNLQGTYKGVNDGNEMEVSIGEAGDLVLVDEEVVTVNGRVVSRREYKIFAGMLVETDQSTKTCTLEMDNNDEMVEFAEAINKLEVKAVSTSVVKMNFYANDGRTFVATLIKEN